MHCYYTERCSVNRSGVLYTRRGLQFSIIVREHRLSFYCRNVLEYVAGLTFQNLTQHVERGEPDSANLARLDARQIHVGDPYLVSKVVQRNMAIRHDLVEVEDNRHATHLQRLVREFLKQNAVLEHEGEGKDYGSDDEWGDIDCNYNIGISRNVAGIYAISQH